MKVLILAAGYATRLYPYTKNFPKPLLKIKNRPVIDYLIEKINELDNVSGVIVVTNNRFFRQFKKWESTVNSRFPLCIINDFTTSPKDKLGAIGDMNLVFDKQGSKYDFLVLGGDNLFHSGLLDFVNFARSRRPSVSIGLFDIGSKKDACHYGVVSINKNKRIIDFSEKPKRPKSSLVAMCLYYFPRTKLGLIKEYLNNPLNCSDAAGAYISWLYRENNVYGFVFNNFWLDIGHVHTYKRVANLL